MGGIGESSENIAQQIPKQQRHTAVVMLVECASNVRFG